MYLLFGGATTAGADETAAAGTAAASGACSPFEDAEAESAAAEVMLDTSLRLVRARRASIRIVEAVLEQSCRVFSVAEGVRSYG
jgi:hypothetical protein